MVVFPHCKINLGLHVLFKREDAYHNIETCFYPVPRFDVLEAIKSDSFSFDQTGIFIPGVSSDNLCIRAYEFLKKDYDLGSVKIHLHKTVPIGAGLGGGSSDAAFMLQLLSELFNLNLSNNQLQDYSSRLGSDCAFFVQKKPKIGTGRGELLEGVRVNLSGYWMCLVKPEIHISTAEAYAGIHPQAHDQSIREILNQPIRNWKSQLRNDFERRIFKKFPLLNELKERLYSLGAIYAAMSGSGSAIYGLFPTQPNLKAHFREMDYWEGELK